MGPLEPLLAQLAELLASQEAALAALRDVRPVDTTEPAHFAELLKYQGERGGWGFFCCVSPLSEHLGS